jgi:exonuclease SbcD
LVERASAARMWEAIVSRAITERVDAVLLSGDIVDHDNRFYEATGPLERGILRLAEAGIPTYAVAGNHDWDVFPRILAQLDTPLFHFVGQEGRWEDLYLERDGERLLRIVGWSFPAQHVRRSPLQDFPALAESRLPTVGLLHADVDVPDSSYAPVRLAELQARSLSLWVLGHIHKPRCWTADAAPTVLYPGSPQALSPAEPGPHGPWLIDVDGPQSVTCRQLPMSLVRYEEREADLSGVETEEGFETRVQQALVAALEEVAAEEGQPPELLVLRLKLVGATPLCGRIDQLAGQLDELERQRGDIRGRIDKHDNRTRPAVDLEELARGNNPAGTLARTLLALERDVEDESLSALVNAAVARLKEVHQAPAYAVLNDPLPDRRRARDILLQQGRLLLEALRLQLAGTQEEPA